MAQDLWYYSRDGEEKMGPTPGDHLRHWVDNGQLPADTLIWRPGMDDWTPVQNVEAFRAPTGQKAVAKAHGTDTQRLLIVLQQFRGDLSPKSFLNLVSSKILWFGVIAPLIVIKILIIPSVASRAASVWAEGHGIEMSVENWSSDLLNLSTTAKNAVILIPGSYAKTKFLSAEAIEVDLSLWSGLFGEHWVRDIRIKEPKIYIERLLSGRWNYHDLMAAPIPPRAVIRKNEQEGNVPAFTETEIEGQYSFSLTGLSVEEMDLEWVENMPGNSKSGIIQEVKAKLFIDDISIDTKNLIGMVDLSTQRNSLLNLEARTGSGKISFNGRANLFFWKVSEERADEVDWMPTLKGQIYLENVGTSAFARLMPDAAILPEGGTINGTIDLDVADRQVECHANLNIRDGSFTANQSSRFVGNNAVAISKQLSNYRADGQYQFSCGGRLGEGTYRPFQAFQTKMVRRSVDRAPPNVRVLAAVEHGRCSEDPIDPSLENEVRRVLGKVDSKWLIWAGLGARLRSRFRS